jgi:hypothetical protein
MGEEAEADDVRNELHARALEYTQCVEDAAELMYSITALYAERGTGSVPELADIAAALRIWLAPETIDPLQPGAPRRGSWRGTTLRCGRASLMGVPGAAAAQARSAVQCLPVGEVQPEGTVGQVRRMLDDYATQMGDDTLQRRVLFAMPQMMRAAHT